MAAPPFRVKALYEYSSNEEDDLKFPVGQVITVTDVEDDDWFFGEFADTAGTKKEGLFPKNFVKIFEPETPPRPSRPNKSRKEPEGVATVQNEEKGPAAIDTELSSPHAGPTSSEPKQASSDGQEEIDIQQPQSQNIKPEPVPAAPPEKAATKPVPPTNTKPAPPSTGETAGVGSFRDRINAFNKPAAPPVAPTKPTGLGSSGGSGFVKKPFVAPPPSKNAYVPPPREPPPQKIYRREEDPEVVSQAHKDIEHEEEATQPKAVPSSQEEEDQPKPTSLKDRIALLQKQQMEQAARRADAGQKKDKPKPPSKKRLEAEAPTEERPSDMEAEALEKITSADTAEKRSMDSSRDAPPPIPRSNTRTRKSQETTPLGSPAAVRDLLSDPNDADQSGVGETEDGEELSNNRDHSNENTLRKSSIPLPRPSQPPVHEADVGDEEDNAEENAEGDEEEDVDPEVKRRMEIRERMAKMSGGMGMAGMFGPPGGLPSKSGTKQASGSSNRKASANSASGQADNPTTRAPAVPIMPMPGLQKVRSPEQSELHPEVSKEDEDVQRSVVGRRDPEEMPEVEDMTEEPMPPSRRSTERPPPPPIPHDRPVPAPINQGRGPPPPIPTERPAQTLSESRPLPPPPPGQPMSPSEGSESDDEMPTEKGSRPTSREGPPALPAIGTQPTLPSRPVPPGSRPSESGRSPTVQSQEFSPSSPTNSTAHIKRDSRAPPVPSSNTAMPSAPQARAPPPPPPTNAPPSRAPTFEGRVPPMPPPIPKGRNQESDEEVTEYEGDYDTDIASSAPHKDALKSHARAPSLDDDPITDEASPHHSGLPSLEPSSSGAPRAVPPPPPNQAPKVTRQSSDMPRAAPPSPPLPKEQAYDEGNDDYDPYNYSRTNQSGPPRSRYDAEKPITPRIEDPDPMATTSPHQRSASTMGNQLQSQHLASPSLPAPSNFGSGARQSMDVQRSNTTLRRSVDGPRASGEHGSIANDIDLGSSSQWWTRPDTPPPIFQNRRDLVFEIEETSTTRRGGKQAITRIVYVLFMDYSQTVVTAHFEAREPANVSLDQRHEPPPQNLRQDQLENAHTRFGSRIAEGAAPKEGSIVGDGSPNALVLDLLSPLPDALLPVGVRAYGALIYANLANASVRQFDEIRPGDIVTFRNAKFQGHRGTMHSKYSNEVGKPDHVGVVIDWDGTKKKIRAWEQGRESKKVKSESFKLGDMRSGEVRVWRVMARSWVGWEGQN
ncbi:assembly of actin patch protein [Lecanora helva]